MSIASTDRGVALCILLGMFAFVLMYFGLARYRVRRLFGPRRQDIAILEPVRQQLERINAECRRFVFSAERAATVSLAGHNVQVVYGLVGFVEPPAGGTGHRVYAIAQGDGIEWMRHFPDVFELADSTATAAVFWVKLPALMRLARRPPASPSSK